MHILYQQDHVIIRKAVVSDSKRIFDLVKASVEHYGYKDKTVGEHHDLAHCLFRDNTNTHAVVLEISGKIVGLAIYFFSFSTMTCREGLYVEEIFVDSDYRGKGYGKLIMKSLANIAGEHNCSRMDWICLDANDVAIKFYSRLGAEPANGWQTYWIDQKEIEGLSNLVINIKN